MIPFAANMTGDVMLWQCWEDFRLFNLNQNTIPACQILALKQLFAALVFPPVYSLIINHTTATVLPQHLKLFLISVEIVDSEQN